MTTTKDFVKINASMGTQTITSVETQVIHLKDLQQVKANLEAQLADIDAMINKLK